MALRTSEILHRDLDRIQVSAKRLRESLRLHHRPQDEARASGEELRQAASPSESETKPISLAFEVGVSAMSALAGAVAGIGGALLAASVSDSVSDFNPYTSLALVLVGLSLIVTILAAVKETRAK